MRRLWIIVGLLFFVSLIAAVAEIAMGGCITVWCFDLRPRLSAVSIDGVLLGTILAISLFTWGLIKKTGDIKSTGEGEDSVVKDDENLSYIKKHPFRTTLWGIMLATMLLLALLIGWPLLLPVIYNNPAADISDNAVVKITFDTNVGTKTVELPQDEAKAVISLLKGRPDEVSRHDPWMSGGILVFPDGSITIDNINYEFESHFGWTARREGNLLWKWAFWREKNDEFEYIKQMRKEMEQAEP